MFSGILFFCLIESNEQSRPNLSPSKFPMNDVRSLFGAEFSAEHIAVLQQTKIDEQLPGPLLANIETLINFIGTGLKTTSAYFALPQRVLAELNEAMVEPLPHDLKRPQLRSFPTLMGLFMLLRSPDWRSARRNPNDRLDGSSRAGAVAISQSDRTFFQSYGILPVRCILGLRRNAKPWGYWLGERNPKHVP